MKIYVCFTTDECEGTYEYPDRSNKWIAFRDEYKAKEWVDDKDREFTELRNQGKFIVDSVYTPAGADYQEVEIIE